MNRWRLLAVLPLLGTAGCEQKFNENTAGAGTVTARWRAGGHRRAAGERTGRGAHRDPGRARQHRGV